MATKDTKRTPGTEKGTTTVTTYTFDGFKMNGETVAPEEGKIPLTFTNTYTEPGKQDKFDVAFPTLELDKILRVVNGAKPDDKSFKFIVEDKDHKQIKDLSVLIGDMSAIDTIGKDDSTWSGKSKIEFNFATGEEPKEAYTFYVREDSGNKLDNVTYSDARYRVVVPIKNSWKEFGDLITTHYVYGKPVIDLVDENDTVITANVSGIEFTNIFNKPNEATDFTAPQLDLTKKLEVRRGTAPADKSFNFVVTDEQGNKVDEQNISIADLLKPDANNTSSTKVTFDFFTGTKPSEGKHLFYVKEVPNGIDNVTYSQKQYRVTVELNSNQTSNQTTNPLEKYTITTHFTYDTPTIEEAVFDAEGNVIAWEPVTAITFNNVFETPRSERPRNPDPTPDPETPPTPTIPDEEVPLGPAPEEPEVTVPDEEVPLAPQPEVPEVTLPEPEVPLAPMPPETTTIPEPEVPLAGVPQTGDGSGAWFALMALAACGLVVLNLRKKENEI